MDKRHYQRKFENAEIQISQLREELQQLKLSKQVIGHKSALEQDGLQLFDLKAEDFEDLRESLAPENRPLALMIESVSKERDMLRLRVESMQREHLNQTLGKLYKIGDDGFRNEPRHERRNGKHSRGVFAQE